MVRAARQGEKLAAIFTALARQIVEDTNVRAGMKLTLEPTIDKRRSLRLLGRCRQ
ncbi:hypothetical protein [Rhodococcus qingshengii]|uniref:hypothetical protein n=1 Tax=Rhodococcus qingshengii TaxID=334542 RepID=UPI0002B7CC73|nr:hypothetical protein [Rhodococcus qingshengii]EME19423.1 TetR family transcriptional regulator [Rhodococcus qingshengii BKS 20-40]